MKLLIFIFCGLPKEYKFEPKSKAIFLINLISLDIITEYIWSATNQAIQAVVETIAGTIFPAIFLVFSLSH